MLTLEYHPDGLCVADAKTMEIAESFVQRANDTKASHHARFSQAMILDAVRVLVKRGVIDHTKLIFQFGCTPIRVDKEGCLNDWPRGFCDYTEDYLVELLG